MKVGLVTSSSRAAPRPLTMPLVSVVLPLPIAGESISTGAVRRLANSRPSAVVSSGDRVMRSSTGTVPSREKLRVSCRKRFDDIGSYRRRFADSLRGDVARQSVKIDSHAQGIFPPYFVGFDLSVDLSLRFLGAELRG